MSVTIKNNTAAVMALFNKAEERLLTRWGIRGESAVIPKVPVDTGKLRSSITYKVDTPNKAAHIGSK